MSFASRSSACHQPEPAHPMHHPTYSNRPSPQGHARHQHMYAADHASLVNSSSPLNTPKTLNYVNTSTSQQAHGTGTMAPIKANLLHCERLGFKSLGDGLRFPNDLYNQS
eukprot:scaffold551157_cov20-Prasinocladus_malaysianus.AAC.1